MTRFGKKEIHGDSIYMVKDPHCSSFESNPLVDMEIEGLSVSRHDCQSDLQVNSHTGSTSAQQNGQLDTREMLSS